MLQPVSLDLLVKAQGMALFGIIEWMSERTDVPPAIAHSLLNAVSANPVLVGGDLGSEAEAEMKEKANAILTRLGGTPAF